MNEHKDAEQRAKLADAVKKYNENPTSENFAKFVTEFAKLGIVWSNYPENEKELAKDWTDLSYELFATRNYDKAKAIICKLLSDINDLNQH